MLRTRLIRTVSSLTFTLAMFPIGGCNVKYSATANASCNVSTGQCTVGGAITISSGGTSAQVSPEELTASTASGYTVIFAVPTAELTPSSSPVQTTLTGTTDQGYTASITETLTPAGSAPDPTYSGYTDYSFTMPPSTTLTNWVDALNLNTTDSSTVVNSSSGVFSPAGNAGTYAVYVSLTSTQTGTVPSGSAVFTDPGPSSGPIRILPPH